MPDADENRVEDEVPESPATWENVVVGRAVEAAGRVLRDEDMTEEGEEQAEIAHEVREEYDEERDDKRGH